MQIGDFAARAGVSPRALRHYEDQGLLVPSRTAGGYRDYDETDLVTVRRVRMMIEAGLGTAAIAAYLDCVRQGADGSHLVMCSGLRAELDAVAQRLDAETARIERTRGALCQLVADPDPSED